VINQDELRTDVPDTFFSAFTDEADRHAAEVLVSWARARALRFYRKTDSQSLETWQVVFTGNGEREHLLTLQPRRGSRGQPDIPLSWMTGYFGGEVNRTELIQRVSKALSKTPLPNVGDRKFWAFLWADVHSEERLQGVVEALDWALLQMKEAAASERNGT
jgi:hypothetical protein